MQLASQDFEVRRANGATQDQQQAAANAMLTGIHAALAAHRPPLRLHLVEGDGNCFFTALAMQLPDITAVVLRQRVSAEWRRRSQEPALCAAADRDVLDSRMVNSLGRRMETAAEYAEYIAQDRSYATDADIKLVSDIVRCCVVLWQDTAAPIPVPYGDGHPVVHIVHNGHRENALGHFHAALPLDHAVRIQLPHLPHVFTEEHLRKCMIAGSVPHQATHGVDRNGKIVPTFAQLGYCFWCGDSFDYPVPEDEAIHCHECGCTVCGDCAPVLQPVPLRHIHRPVRVCNNCTLIRSIESARAHPRSLTWEDAERHNVLFFPRNEFFARYAGTTAFTMLEAKFWGQYYRCASSRSYKLLGPNPTHFSPGISRKTGRGYSAMTHTGSHTSALRSQRYRGAFDCDEAAAPVYPQAQLPAASMRDAVLEYKVRVCHRVVGQLDEELVDLVTVERAHPFLVVRIRALADDKYIADHPKPMQRLLMACFIVLANEEAKRIALPIEIVHRAGFGAHQPSVCETHGSFRINIGLVPMRYAHVLVAALGRLRELAGTLSLTSGRLYSMPPALREAQAQSAHGVSQWDGHVLSVLKQKANPMHDVLYELMCRHQYGVDLLVTLLFQGTQQTGVLTRDLLEQCLVQLINCITYESKSRHQSTDFAAIVQQTVGAQMDWPLEAVNPDVEDSEWSVLVCELCTRLGAPLPRLASVVPGNGHLEPTFGEQKNSQDLSPNVVVRVFGIFEHLDRANYSFVKRVRTAHAEDSYGDEAESDDEGAMFTPGPRIRDARGKHSQAASAGAFLPPELLRLHCRKFRMHTGMKAVCAGFIACQHVLLSLMRRMHRCSAQNDPTMHQFVVCDEYMYYETNEGLQEAIVLPSMQWREEKKKSTSIAFTAPFALRRARRTSGSAASSCCMISITSAEVPLHTTLMHHLLQSSAMSWRSERYRSQCFWTTRALPLRVCVSP